MSRFLSLTEAEKNRIRAARESGVSLGDLAGRFRVTKRTMADWCRDLNIDGRKRRVLFNDFSIADQVAMKKAYDDGDSLSILGARYGVTGMAVRSWLLAMGVVMRPQGSNTPRSLRWSRNRRALSNELGRGQG